MKSILFALALPILAQAQITDTFPLQIQTIPLKVTGDGTPENPYRTAPDTATHGQIDSVEFSGWSFGEAFYCNTYVSDTIEVSFCSNGDISISRIRRSPPIDTLRENDPKDTTFYIIYRNVETISELRLKDTTGLLFKTIEANNTRMYTMLDELQEKVRIYEAYYGIIKGRPYQEGDCIEMLPPRYPRTPCEPKVKAPAKKKPVHPAKRT